MDSLNFNLNTSFPSTPFVSDVLTGGKTIAISFPNGKKSAIFVQFSVDGNTWQSKKSISPTTSATFNVSADKNTYLRVLVAERPAAASYKDYESGGGGISIEYDPTVPSWAKQPTKPKYTAQEVGAASEEQLSELSQKVGKIEQEQVTVKEIEEVMQNLTDGSAVTAQVAVNAGKISELEKELYEGGKNLVWNEGYVISGRGCKASAKDKVLSPIILKRGETIKVTTKGDGSYWQTIVGKVSSLITRIEVNTELVSEALVTQDTQSLKTYAYTATEDVIIVVSVLNDASTEVVFENLQKDSKVEKNTQDIASIKEELKDVSNKEILSVTENIHSYAWSGYNNGYACEDVLQNLPVGAKLKKIKCASTGTKGSNFTFLYIYDNNYQLVGERIRLGAIGTSETTFDISSLNIVVQEGWHYCLQYVAQIYVGNNEYQDRYMYYSTGEPKSLGNGYAFGFAWEYEYESSKMESCEKNTLRGKYMSTIGDSVCAGAGFSGGYAKLIAEKYGMLAPQNLGSSGATITQDSSLPNKTYISMLVDKMDENADFFIAEGGVNDADHNEPLGIVTSGYNAELDLTTYCGAFEYMCKQLVTKYHGKKVGYILVHRVSASSKYSHTLSGDNYYGKAIEICEKWGVPYLDLNKGVPPFGCISTLKDLYTKHDASHPNGDGYHPNKDGYARYYVDRIAEWMKSL